MLSRRSIRIKVMQVLYAMSKDETLTDKDGNRMYYSYVNKTYDLFLYNLYVLLQVANQAVEDGEKRKSKHLPTEEDKIFTDKLGSNELVTSVLMNPNIIKEFEQRQFRASLDLDQAKKIYTEYAKEDTYKQYLQKESIQHDHKDILLDLFKFARKNELFIEIVEDKYPNWIDDKSMAIGTVKKVLKALPADGMRTLLAHEPEEEIVTEYGEKLYDTTVENNEEFLAMIQPALQNWDSERLASIDIILIKMALCEFLHFDTIPTKVTLNEYVEIAKQYSTDKSREFVNGILDKLMKQLEDAGKINKTGRGLTN